MAFDFKFIIRDKYKEEIFNIIDLASSIKTSDIKTDYKASNGSRCYSIKTGIGNINSGRSFEIGIPIYEYKNDIGKWIKLEEEYSKYTSIILSGNIKRYFIRIEFENEIYEAEHIITSIGGYNIKYINNLGIITISLEALDKVYLRQKYDSYKLNINKYDKQDIKYKSLSLVPVPIGFTLNFQVITGQLIFLFANRQNFGIQLTAELQGGNYIVNFNGEELTINGVSYDYKGIQPELNVGENTFYLETNQICLEGFINYRRGILI